MKTILSQPYTRSVEYPILQWQYHLAHQYPAYSTTDGRDELLQKWRDQQPLKHKAKTASRLGNLWTEGLIPQWDVREKEGQRDSMELECDSLPSLSAKHRG